METSSLYAGGAGRAVLSVLPPTFGLHRVWVLATLRVWGIGSRSLYPALLTSLPAVE